MLSRILQSLPLLRSFSFLFTAWVALFGIGSFAYSWTGGAGGIGITDWLVQNVSCLAVLRLPLLWFTYYATRAGVLVVSAFLLMQLIQLCKRSKPTSSVVVKKSSDDNIYDRVQVQVEDLRKTKSLLDEFFARSDKTTNGEPKGEADGKSK